MRLVLALIVWTMHSLACSTATAQRRPATTCSNGVIDSSDPPMVDMDVPEATEEANWGYDIRRSTQFSTQGLVVWENTGTIRSTVNRVPYRHLTALDAGRVLSGAALFVRLAAGLAPREQAMRALGTITRRAGQAPLTTRDRTAVAPHIRDPFVAGNTLHFWMLLDSGGFAREVEVDLVSGASNVGTFD